MTCDDLTLEYLHSVIYYDPETGAFTWTTAIGPRTKIGARAESTGSRNSVVIRFGKTAYYAPRLAVFYMTGSWPPAHVAPINGDKSDVRYKNLRMQSHAETVHASKVRSTNQSGFRGVSWNTEKGKWIASLTRDYKRKYLGMFDTKEEAVAAVEAADVTDLGGNTDISRKPWNTTKVRWCSYATIQRDSTLAGWATIDEFHKELGQPPSDKHIVSRRNCYLPLGPSNAEWRLPRGGEQGQRDAKRNYHLSRYGISNDEYQRMLVEQDGKCAACKQPERHDNKQLAVDHDHITNVVRQLLCFNCNVTLGSCGDDPEILETLATYIRRHRSLQTNIIPLKKAASDG